MKKILFFIIFFNLKPSDHQQLQVVNKDLKDHLIILFNEEKDRDSFLKEINRLAKSNKLKIYEAGLIKTNYNCVYGAKIPFAPPMTKDSFELLLDTNISSDLLNKAFVKELKFGLTYNKIEVSFITLKDVIKFFILLLYSKIQLTSIEFPGEKLPIYNRFHMIVNFKPLSIQNLSNILDRINFEIKYNTNVMKIFADGKWPD